MGKGTTTRFDRLVAAAGAPEGFTPWTDPEKDAAFQRAVRENRVVTVHQQNVGTKKDFGTVGFERAPHATYLIFPKQLPASEGSKVVGIKYDKIAAPEVKDAVQVKEKQRKRRARKGVTQPRDSKEPESVKAPREAKIKQAQEYSVPVEVRVTFQGEARVKARNAKEAGAEAKKVEASELNLKEKAKQVRVLKPKLLSSAP